MTELAAALLIVIGVSIWRVSIYSRRCRARKLAEQRRRRGDERIASLLKK